MARIGIITGSSLAHNPRVQKEATALAGAGHKVTVVGGGRDRERYEIEQSLAARHGFVFNSIDLKESPDKAPASRAFHRVIGRLARTLHTLTGIESLSQLGGNPGMLFKEAKALEADYYIVHMEPAMWVGSRLLQERHRVGIDFEDWYSEDLLPEARKHRPLKLLRSLESRLLREGAHSTSPSRAMAAALAGEYGGSAPEVIYNAFPWSDRQKMDGRVKDRKDTTIPSIHWYSQTLGRGRGLEDLLAALPSVQYPVEIHLRGTPVKDFAEWLWTRLPEAWRERLFLHSLVSNDELLSRIAEHDIGFAGEMKYCRSRDLTVTNKILHYLLGGLAVIASDTAGQREVAEQAHGAVHTYPTGDSQALAKVLNNLLASSEKLQSAKTAALKAAEQTFCWEQQARKLLLKIEKAL